MTTPDMNTIQYVATFSRPEHLGEATLKTIVRTEEGCANGDLLSLLEVCDVCSSFGVKADMFDADNRKRGSVDAQGNYTLT